MRKKTGMIVGIFVLVVAGVAFAAQFTHWRDTVLWDRGEGVCALACREAVGIGHLVTYREGDGVRGLTHGDKIVGVRNFVLTHQPLPGTEGPRPVRGALPAPR